MTARGKFEIKEIGPKKLRSEIEKRRGEERMPKLCR